MYKTMDHSINSNTIFHIALRRVKKQALLLLLTVAFIPLHAQQTFRHEWSVSLGGGASTLHRSAVAGDFDFGGVTGAAGASFTEFFSPRWGIEAGVEIAWYYNSFSVDRISHTTTQPTPPGLNDASSFYRTADYTGYRERQQTWYAQIPLRLVFHAPAGKQTIYAAGGFKAGIPLPGSESASIREFKTTGYSDYTGQVFETMPGHGFETETGVSLYSRPKWPTLYMLSLETGLRWAISPKNTLSAGICFDYGKVFSQIQPVAFGLKVKVGMGYGKTKKKRIRL
jgi:hypothetical protein